MPSGSARRLSHVAHLPALVVTPFPQRTAKRIRRGVRLGQRSFTARASGLGLGSQVGGQLNHQATCAVNLDLTLPHELILALPCPYCSATIRE